MATFELKNSRLAHDEGAASQPLQLKAGRLIPAGVNCPFSGICPDAKFCNRPQNMALDFSCAQARAFDRLEKGGSLAQGETVYGITGASISKPKPQLMDFFEEVVSPEQKTPGHRSKKKWK